MTVTFLGVHSRRSWRTKSNFKKDGPGGQAALQKLAKRETVSECEEWPNETNAGKVGEARASIEKYKPSMYPQATAVEGN